MFSQDIKNIIESTLVKRGYPSDFIPIQVPTVKSHGDYATSVALVLSKKLHRKPMDLATEITQDIKNQNQEILENIEVVSPGFINFSLKEKCFIDVLYDVRRQTESYGSSSIGQGKKVIVEYSSPNIAKPFTVGHLRSTIIGDAIANIFEFNGYTVHRDNHLGDWGTQFGKLIVAIKKLGAKEKNEELITASDNPVKLLVDLYVEFHTKAETDPSLEEEARSWFFKLEQGDAEARRIWKKCVNWSLVEFERIYKRLGVDFGIVDGKISGAIGTSIFPESFFEDKMDQVILDLSQKGLTMESRGALIVEFPDEKYPPLMIKKKDGATLYATRDLATDKYRFNTYGKDILIVNEVGAEQKMYFQQLFELEEMLGYCKKEQRVHVAHGLIRFKDGKMSTRKGNTIWLDQVLDEAVSRAGDLNKESAEAVGIGALKFNDLKRACEKEVVFDWDEVLTLKGNSGPYLQYAYARTQSVLSKSNIDVSTLSIKETSLSKIEKDVLQTLIHFPEVVVRSCENFAPHELCTYLFSLAQSFNTFYAEHSILKAKEEEKAVRILLTYAVSNVLSTGLKLLGIVPLKSM